MNKRILAVAALSVMAVSAHAAKNMASGLKPGQGVGAFQVVDVTGPNKGKQLCYRCNYGGNPVVAAFVKGGAPETAAVLENVDKLVKANGGKLRSFVVFMNGPESKPMIEKLAAEHKLTVPLTFLPQGPKAEDIGAYNINPEASNTVMLWTKGTVHASFANVDAKSFGEVEKAAAAMLK